MHMAILINSIDFFLVINRISSSNTLFLFLFEKEKYLIQYLLEIIHLQIILDAQQLVILIITYLHLYSIQATLLLPPP